MSKCANQVHIDLQLRREQQEERRLQRLAKKKASAKKKTARNATAVDVPVASGARTCTASDESGMTNVALPYVAESDSDSAT